MSYLPAEASSAPSISAQPGEQAQGVSDAGGASHFRRFDRSVGGLFYRRRARLKVLNRSELDSPQCAKVRLPALESRSKTVSISF